MAVEPRSRTGDRRGCCGGDGGSASPEGEVKDTVSEFLEAVIAGENGKACAMTTDVETCLSGLVAAEGFLGEGGFEALLGEDWRDGLENAEVTFADDDHASVPPITPIPPSPPWPPLTVRGREI